MIVLNNKGQAFSTFQLLIAAIVAIAILAILFQILGIIPGIGQQEPSSNAADLVKSLVNKPATPKTSSQVTFKPGESINAKSIAEGSQAGVTAASISLTKGDFANDQTFEVGGTGALRNITYKGSSSKNVRLWAICDAKRDIQADVEALKPSETFDSGTEFCPEVEDGETCCLIGLRTTR